MDDDRPSDDPVARHYATGDDIAAAIADRLGEMGARLEGLKPETLAAVDEFHIRGRPATLEVADALAVGPGARILDLGSGLGGPARTVAQEKDVFVTGVDLTPAFTDAARTLSDWVGLSDRTEFQTADAAALPFRDATFDAAMTLHVAMNIPVKDRFYAEAHRVLKPGARLVLYDVMRGDGGEILYPAPWARESSISHVAAPDETRELLAAAGFHIVEEVDSTPASQTFFETVQSRLASDAPPPLTFQLFLGDAFPEMVANMVRNLADRRIRTVMMVAEK